MRWKGFIILIVFLAIGTVVSVLFIDRWIEYGLEKTAQAIVGVRVEIDNLDFCLLGLSIKWDRLQVTDPKNTMRNILETGRTVYNMNAQALLRKRIIIDEMTLSDVRTGTQRTYDGVLPKKKKKPPKRKEKPGMVDKVKARLNREMVKLPVMRFDASVLKRKLNLDTLIVTVDLKVIERIDSVKEDVVRTAEKWETFYKDFHPENDFQKIRTDFSSVDPKQIKTVPDLLAVLEKVKSAQNTLNGLSETVKEKHGQISGDFDRVTSYQQQLSKWIDEDYQKILQKARLPDLSVKNIGKILFGTTVVHQVNRYLDYLQWIQKFMPKKSERQKKEKKPRMAGQTIYFPDRHHWPTFLIRKVHLSGQTGISEEQPGLVMSGKATGMTSQPWIYGEPTIIDLKGEKQYQHSVFLNAVLDHTTESPSDSLNFSIKNIILNNVKLQETLYLPSRIKKGKAYFNCLTRIQKDNLLIKIDLNARGIDFDFTNFQTTDGFTSIVRDVVSRMNLLTLHSEIFSRGDDFDFKLNSNVDDLVSRELKRLASQKLTETQNQIRSRLHQIRDQKRAELEKIFTEKRREIQGPINDYKKQVDEIQHEIEEKINEIQKDIDRRKKTEESKLQDKAKELLEGILKK